MKAARETWLSIGLVVLLIAVTVFAAVKKGVETIPYLSTSSDPTGVLALKLWMDELGFESIENIQSTFDPPSQADLIFILEPAYLVTDSDFRLLDQWVENGGTLILAGNQEGAYRAFQHYGFYMSYVITAPSADTLHTPLLTFPPITGKLDLQTDAYLEPLTGQVPGMPHDYVAHLAASEGPVLLSFNQGKGRVILSTSVYIFSNRGLKTGANSLLVLNLINFSGKIRSVWFDEWHHGIRPDSVIGPEQWLRHTPAGHAVLFAATAIFLALLIQGRGFGRPLPLAHEMRRRGPLEHVNAISNLNRKAGHRASVLKRYRHDLKRHVGKRYLLDPSLPDEEYVKRLVGFNSALDGEALLSLLTNLDNDKVSEAEMVRLAAESARWMGQTV